METHMQELDKKNDRLESQGKFPSQTEPNLRHNASAKMLRSGTILEPVPSTSCTLKVGRERRKLDSKAPMESTPQKPFAKPPSFLERLVQWKKE
ncbi:hypothetical protein EPI10_023306 [Gossypium australe]|uniref:Uncharacterized protein n=1 Tax=Gossypium australe TaxID=47621 RepID=A0A5B6VVC9_9ROSI|nr:hypothetical protein EPI10_023306 [Gossypium australe]